MTPRPIAAARLPGAGRRLVPLLAALLLAACASEEGLRPVAPADGPAALAERLPPAAAGFRRGAEAPLDQPLPGVEVDYATEGRQAAGFVQVLRVPGGPPPADGPGSAIVEEEFRRWREESARGPMRARRLSVVAEFEEPGAAPLFRCAALEGSYGRQPVQSQICVGVAGGQLLRVRASMPRRNPPVADPRAFVREVAAGLRGQPVMAEMPALPADPAAPEAAPPPAPVPAATRPPPRPAARTPAPARTGAAPVRSAPRAGTTAPAPARR